MQSQEDIISRLLEKDLDELYIDIGRELYGSASFPPQLNQLGQVARVWLQAKRVEIARAVCPNKTIQMLISNRPTTQDQLVLVTAVADLIASLVIGVSPVTVAVLLVKEGLKTLCDDNQ